MTTGRVAGRRAGDLLRLAGEEVALPPNVPTGGDWAELNQKFSDVNMTATSVSSQLNPNLTKAELFN